MGQMKNAAQDRKDSRRDATPRGDDKQWRGFVDCELTTEHKGEVRRLADRYGEAWTHVMDCVFHGYKLSVSYDNRTAAYTVALTCWRASDKNNGLCLAAKGGSVQAAVIALWYKDTVVLGGAWTAKPDYNVKVADEFDVS